MTPLKGFDPKPTVTPLEYVSSLITGLQDYVHVFAVVSACACVCACVCVRVCVCVWVCACIGGVHLHIHSSNTDHGTQYTY